MKNDHTKKVIIIMGVSGSGKSSVGRLLSKEISVPFIDADDHHPYCNIEKMSQGIPLTDVDRKPWLDVLHEIAVDHIDSGCVIACSALKDTYRRQLIKSIESNVIWVYLKGEYDQISERMKNREDHFMDNNMLKSQFETLEAPKDAINIDIANTMEVIVHKIKSHLR